MTKNEEQLIEQLADLRREEVTRLNEELAEPQASGASLDLTSDQRKMWEPGEFEKIHSKPGEIILVDELPSAQEELRKPLFPAIQDAKAGGSNVKQYWLPKGAKELQDLIEYRGMNFAQGNIFKAQYRAGHCSHSDELRDARKTLWFAQREVERLSNG